jgi:C1A family cysteine protease
MKSNPLTLIFMLVSLLLLGGCQSNDPVSTILIDLLKDRRQGLNRTPSATLSKVKVADRRSYLGNIPSKFTLNTPPVEPNGQGNECSCVSWAIAYTARSFYLNTSFTNANGSINYASVCSPEYMYNQTKISLDCEKGSYFISSDGKLGALDLLVQQGVCKWKDMPYTDEGCAIQPNSSQKSSALSAKISKYEQVAGFSTLEIKKLLLSQTPIIIGAMVDEGFVNATKSFVWNSKKGKDLGGHALVIMGYDDAKNAFKIQNSWTTSWGDSGYSWLDYNYYNQVVFEAFIIYPN